MKLSYIPTIFVAVAIITIGSIFIIFAQHSSQLNQDSTRLQYHQYSKPLELRPKPIIPPTVINDTDMWQSYIDPISHISFKLPPHTMISVQGQQYLQITGHHREGSTEATWPIITITFGYDAEPGSDFYNPPPGSDVKQWVLYESPYHLSLGKEDEIIGAKSIAGVSALHIAFNGCTNQCQAYASDDYFLITGTRLFRISLSHIIDNPDWNIYNEFLDSILFNF